MFKPQTENKWDLLLKYVTGKAENNEIIRNVIEERNNNKVKSLEDVNLGRKRNNCKRKQNKLARLMRNNGNFVQSDAFRTMNNSPMRNLEDSTNNQQLEYSLNKRECFSKSPIGSVNTIDVNRN